MRSKVITVLSLWLCYGIISISAHNDDLDNEIELDNEIGLDNEIDSDGAEKDVQGFNVINDATNQNDQINQKERNDSHCEADGGCQEQPLSTPSSVPNDGSCIDYHPSEPSVVVGATNGRLGNQMYVMKSLLDLRLTHGLRVFLPRELRDSLLRFFPNVALEHSEDGVLAPEDAICGFEEFYAKIE